MRHEFIDWQISGLQVKGIDTKGRDLEDRVLNAVLLMIDYEGNECYIKSEHLGEHDQARLWDWVRESLGPEDEHER